MEELIVVLDISGSMKEKAKEAKIGFNQFIQEQKKVGDANLTVIFFDDRFDVMYEGRLSQYPPLFTYPWRGMTRLLDAIGKTFEHVRDRFTREKPGKVTLAVLTDGFENDSRVFTTETVADLIKEHREKYGWSVVFLAADQDAWDTAQHLNIGRHETHSYDSVDTVKGFGTFSHAVTESRTRN